MHQNFRRNGGFSLVELMIALVAGLIVSGAVLAFAMSSMKSNSEYVLSTRLTQELRNTLDLAARDLRRAGYDDNALRYLGNNNVSPFARLRVETATESDGSTSACVLYAYDRSAAGGAVGTLDVGNGEVRGLRRKLATINGRAVGVMEYAVSSGTTKPACGDSALNYAAFPVACNGVWCPLSDSRSLSISQFAVVNNVTDVGAAGSGQMRIRSLDLTLAGRLIGNTEFLRTVQTRVRVQADCALSTFSNCDNVAP